jgi:hypothetical protein
VENPDRRTGNLKLLGEGRDDILELVHALTLRP